MTIDEAIKDLDIIRFNPHWDELVKEEYWQELMEMSMNALEEVQQYRAIGTPEECLRNKDFLDFLADKMNPNDFETYLRIYNALVLFFEESSEWLELVETQDQKGYKADAEKGV